MRLDGRSDPGIEQGENPMRPTVVRVAMPAAPVRVLILLIVVGLALATVGDTGESAIRAEPPEAVPIPTLVVPGQPAAATNLVRQGFPAAKADVLDLTKSDTAWEVEWELTHPNNKPRYP